MSKSTTLYRIYGERGVLLYVGITDTYELRMRNHSEKWWWRDVRRIDTQEYAERSEAKAAETAAIRTESPMHNRAENGPARPGAPIPRANQKVGERKMVTLAEAAEYAGVHVKTIRRYIAAGRIQATRMGPRLIRIDLRDVDEAMRPIPTVGTM